MGRGENLPGSFFCFCMASYGKLWLPGRTAGITHREAGHMITDYFPHDSARPTQAKVRCDEPGCDHHTVVNVAGIARHTIPDYVYRALKSRGWTVDGLTFRCSRHGHVEVAR